MLFDKIPDDGTLAMVDVETYAEAQADGAAYDCWYVDDSAVGKREGDMDRLTYRERLGRFDLHTANGKVTTFGRYAVGPIMAADSYRNFKRNSRRPAGLTA